MRHAGRPSLISTSRRSSATSWFTGRSVRDQVQAHLVTSVWAHSSKHRPKATSIGVLLLVLLTTSAVAWVSIWWVPVYLLFMLLIFITPQHGDRLGLGSRAGEESFKDNASQLRPDEYISHGDNNHDHQIAAPRTAVRLDDNRTSKRTSVSPELASIAISKSRRGRTRTRKGPKINVASSPPGSSATWIRIGPGKYVRADTNLQATDEGQPGEITADTHIPAAASSEVLPALSLPTDKNGQHDQSFPFKAGPNNEGKVLLPADRVMESNTEAHGITPSAFGLFPPLPRSIDHDVPGVSEVTVARNADSSLVANPDTHVTEDGESQGRRRPQGNTLRSQRGRSLRGIAKAVPRGNRPYLRYNVRKGPGPRTMVEYPQCLNARRKRAGYSAFGRLTHVQRTLCLCSPPYR